jgi:hypothetical protein
MVWFQCEGCGDSLKKARRHAHRAPMRHTPLAW